MVSKIVIKTAKTKLTKLQNLSLGDWKENQNQLLHHRQNQGENEISKSKLICWLSYKKTDFL